jgi:hypothetical protein
MATNSDDIYGDIDQSIVECMISTMSSTPEEQDDDHQCDRDEYNEGRQLSSNSKHVNMVLRRVQVILSSACTAGSISKRRISCSCPAVA